MNFTIEHKHEEGGRWIAEVPELPGVLAYGPTREEAMMKGEALALRVLAERSENNETSPAYFDRHRCCMTSWPSTKAKRVLAAPCRAGWTPSSSISRGHTRRCFV